MVSREGERRRSKSKSKARLVIRLVRLLGYLIRIVEVKDYLYYY